MDFKIRENRGKAHGRKTLVRERQEYCRLMDQGVSSREACRIVGCNRRTGKRWRNGLRATAWNKERPPPIRRPGSQDGPSRYLCEADRVHIADRLPEKAFIRTIAAQLGRSPSTISREIRRNRTVLADGRWYYRPYAADSRARARKPRPKLGKTGTSPELREYIQDLLGRRWSPEQIAQQLCRDFRGRPEMHVTHETIYQALYAQGRAELRR